MHDKNEVDRQKLLTQLMIPLTLSTDNRIARARDMQSNTTALFDHTRTRVYRAVVNHASFADNSDVVTMSVPHAADMMV